MRRPRDRRVDRAGHVGALRAKQAGYLPGWSIDEGGGLWALMQIAGRYLERLDDEYHHALDGTLLAFLDAVGERRLSAQASEAPLVFALGDDAAADVAVSAGTQVQAEPPVPADPDVPPPLFSTVEPFTIARASLVHVYSVSPGDDTYADHTEDMARGFVAFDDMRPIEHSIYLGDALFDLPKVGCCAREEDDEPVPETIVHLRFDFQKLLQVGEEREAPTLEVRWEFYGETGWLPLQEKVTEGRPEHSLFGQELVVLQKPFGPASKALTLEGHESYWIRGRLLEPLPRESFDAREHLPVVDRVFVTVESRLDGLLPDAAVRAGRPLDISQPFYPFGRLPRTHDAFYVACREAFKRSHTLVRMHVVVAGGVDLSERTAWKWEYFNGAEYVDLGLVERRDLGDVAEYRFRRPIDWQESKFDGTSNYWLRIRVTKDDGGSATTLVVEEDEEGPAGVEDDGTAPESTKSLVVRPTITPPLIEHIAFSFHHLSPTEAVRYGVASNDFVRSDVSGPLRQPGRPFLPFRREGAPRDALCFAFDGPLPPSLVSIYAHIDEDLARSSRGLRFVWEYWKDDGWQDLSVRDRTWGLRTSGAIQFVGPWDATPSLGLGDRPLYRIRARLKEGQVADPVPVGSLWFNAIMARDERVHPRIPLGTSSGNPKQLFRVAKGQRSILADEVVEVREWARATGGPPPFEEELPVGHHQLVHDPATGSLEQVWVRWTERASLLRSGPGDRHYTIDRTMGTIRFGDGHHGRIPAPGAALRISYLSGGGTAGNVPAGTIRVPRAALAGLQSVTNPLAAVGGAPAEPLEDTRRRGPRRIRHGDRALTEADYEWLAREASPAVARARCLPSTGPGGGGRRGWVTVVVIPHGTERAPMPDAALRRCVTEFLAARVPAAIAGNVRVVSPTYRAVSIAATIVPNAISDLTSLEASVRRALDGYLHPLMGGPAAEGWPVGARIYLSQIAQLVEANEGVDRALELRLLVDGAEQGEVARLASHELPTSGMHELTFALEEAR